MTLNDSRIGFLQNAVGTLAGKPGSCRLILRIQHDSGNILVQSSDCSYGKGCSVIILQQRSHVIIKMFMAGMARHAGRLVYDNEILIFIQDLRSAADSGEMGNVTVGKTDFQHIPGTDQSRDIGLFTVQQDSVFGKLQT